MKQINGVKKMKKTLLSVLACSAILLSIISCQAGPDVEEPSKAFDMRNKLHGKVTTFRAGEEPGKEFSYEFLDHVEGFLGENGREDVHASFATINGAVVNTNEDFEQFKNAVIIEDDPNGVKFTFTRPTGFADKPITYINIQYLDGVCHKSTGVIIPDSVMAQDATEGKIEVVYPLVDPNNELTRFWIQLASTVEEEGKEKDIYYADLSFKVTPVNGYGCVDDVLPSYKIRDNLTITEDGKLILKKYIPPVAKEGTLKHAIGFTLKTSPELQYSEAEWKDNNKNAEIKLGLLELAAENEVEASDVDDNEENPEDIVFDIAELFENMYFTSDELAELQTAVDEYPYMWASVIYHYKLDIEGLEDYTFATPWTISNVIANPVIDAIKALEL